MDPDADLASVAALMADKHRAQMLLTLLGGTPMSGSALAEAADISRSLASAHLKKLVAGGLVRAQPSGRQQLYSIASEPVADDGGYSLASSGASEFGRFGIDVDRLERRTRPLLRPCLDWSERRYHLAGSLGAALTRSMIERRWITTREASRIVAVTEAGEAGLRDWPGVDLAQLRSAA